MSRLIKTEIELMGRPIWVELKDSDKDPEFIVKKTEIAFKILLNRERRNEDKAEEKL